MSNSQPSRYALTTPLEKIAMGLSGGGYRAAAFHLGSMAYLHHANYAGKTLLERVKMFSTVSGGTIPGVFYAYYKEQGKDFPEIFDNLIKLLDEFDLLTEGMKKLRGESGWPEHKRRNLINAFAALYDEHYVNGGTFADLDNFKKSHIEEVAFNATELSRGSLFRFQNRGTMGNGTFRVPGKIVEPAVKLGDVIAASTCFPGGFEPLAFPNDFFPAGSAAMEVLDKKEEFQEPIGIMDGGICDNQGVDSILKAENRNRDDAPYYFDLIIISDVSSPYMEPFTFSKAEEAPATDIFDSNFNTLKNKAQGIQRSTKLVAYLIGALSILALILSKAQNNWMLGAGIVGFVVFLMLIFSLNALKKSVIDPAQEVWKDINNKFSFYLNKIKFLELESIPFKELREPVIDRVGSLLTLVQEIFLKQIRRLIYGEVYQSHKWRYRQMSNLIYELRPDDFLESRNLGKNKKYGPWLKEVKPVEGETEEEAKKGLKGEQALEHMLGTSIPDVAKDASHFGTTLWFTPEDQEEATLDKLIATGQFTMCYNLIYYLNDIMHPDHQVASGYEALSDEVKSQLEALHTQLLSDWKEFDKNPYFLVPGHPSHSKS